MVTEYTRVREIVEFDRLTGGDMFTYGQYSDWYNDDVYLRLDKNEGEYGLGANIETGELKYFDRLDTVIRYRNVLVTWQ